MAIKSKFFNRCLTPKYLKRILLMFVAFCILAAGLVYWWAGEQTKESLVEQTLHREQVIARSGARSIESFIDLASSSLLTYDHFVSESQIDEIDKILEDYSNEWNDTPVAGFIYIDEDGIIKSHASKSSTRSVGVSVEDREYYKWAKEANDDDVFISKPLVSRIGESKGKYTIAVVTPIMNDGEFDGALTMGLLLSDITKKYLDPLKISEDTNVYLIDLEGTILHSPDTSLIGENYFNFLSVLAKDGEIISIDLKSMVSAKDEGKLVYTKVDSNPMLPNKQLLTFSKVDPVGQKESNINPWYVVIETPSDDAEAFFGPFRNHLVLMLFFAIFVILGLFAIGLVTYRISQRDAYVDGFMHGRKHRKK
ncbi:cache domain-containing protein [Patescibacteria group bacterium]